MSYKKQLSRDRVKTMAGGFSQLGLLDNDTQANKRIFVAHAV